MRRQSWTVAELAEKSDLDVEQVLVALWGEGIEYPVEPSHRVRPADVAVAERAIGIGSSRQKRVSFWLDELGLDRGELTSVLAEMGLRLHPQANTMPKGAIKRLRARYAITVGERTTEPPESLIEAEPYIWSPIGTLRDCDHLTAEEVEQIHEALTLDFAESADPISPPGVKSRPLLESAVGRPDTSYGSEVKYPTIESAAAALLHSLVQNHPFHNGNKRTALVSMLVFLDRHNLVLDSTEEAMFRFMIRVAAHDLLSAGYKYENVPDREVGEITLWITHNSRVIRREERALTWRALIRILRQRECEIVARGEKVTITREIRLRRRLFGGERTTRVESHYINTGDGREVPRAVLKRIRQELHFDVEHGVDSEMFYGGQQEPDFFILEYSKLLKRLARV